MSFVAIIFIQTAFFVENNPPFKFTLPVVIVFPKTIALLFYNIFIVNRNHAVVFTFKIFPSKDISTPFTEDMESTLPFTLL